MGSEKQESHASSILTFDRTILSLCRAVGMKLLDAWKRFLFPLQGKMCLANHSVVNPENPEKLRGIRLCSKVLRNAAQISAFEGARLDCATVTCCVAFGWSYSKYSPT